MRQVLHSPPCYIVVVQTETQRGKETRKKVLFVHDVTHSELIMMQVVATYLSFGSSSLKMCTVSVLLEAQSNTESEEKESE